MHLQLKYRHQLTLAQAQREMTIKIHFFTFFLGDVDMQLNTWYTRPKYWWNLGCELYPLHSYKRGWYTLNVFKEAVYLRLSLRYK